MTATSPHAMENSDAPGAVPPALRRPRSRLFRKYVLLIAMLVGGALLASGGLEIWFSYDENKAGLAQLQREKAVAAAARIEQFMDEITRQIGWTTRAQWSSSVVDQRRIEYLQLLRQAPAVTEIGHLDAGGLEELRVSRLAMDATGTRADFSSDPRFVEAKARKIWYSPVYFRKESEPYITVAIAGTGRDTGVTVAEVNLKFIWDVVSRIKVGQAGYAYVVDARGLLIAHPDIGLVLRKTDFAGLSQVAVALGAPRAAADREEPLIGADQAGRPVLTANAVIKPVDWTVFVDMPLSEAYKPLYESAQRTAALMLLGLALAVLAGLFLARRMVVPIRALQEGAARLGAGDLHRRIDIRTGDELESLAHRFNRMAEDLQESYAGLERKVEERTRELRETLEQQTATAEVLKVISRSPFNLEPVLQNLLETAAKLANTEMGVVSTVEGERMVVRAGLGMTREFFEEAYQRMPVVKRGWASGRAMLDGKTCHIADVLADTEYTNSDVAQKHGYRTALAVPLMREGRALGVITLLRKEVQPYTQREIELVETFADQAVIAVENNRLLSELRESLEQQTATAEVLKVISSSPFDLDPVLQNLLETAAKLADTEKGWIGTYDNGELQIRAGHGMSEAYYAEAVVGVPNAGRGSVAGRALLDGRTSHVADAQADPSYALRDFAVRYDVRSVLAVPLMREGKPIGVIALIRGEVRPFTPREIELTETFADQAAIAVANVKLFDTVQARTRELQESLTYQTAISDVLGIISRSPNALQPIFDAIVTTAGKLCDSEFAMMFRQEGAVYRICADNNADTDFVKYERSHPNAPGRDTLVGRVALEGRAVHIADCLNDPNYAYADGQRLGRYRTMLGVPLLRNGAVVGVIGLLRTTVRPFTDQQVELVSTFASQAVIAIENARLFDTLQVRTEELARSVEELKALGEVGRAVSSTLDLRTVLDTVVARAIHLGEADGCSIYRYKRRTREFLLWHAVGIDPSMEAGIRALHINEDQTVMGKAVHSHEPIQVPDLATLPPAPLRDLSIASGYRAVLVVPLVRADRIFGALVLHRRRTGDFALGTVNLLTTFASQSSLAIQNARLFREIEEKGRQIEIASAHKSQFLANMSHELRTPLNAILGYTELMLDGLYGELGDKSRSVLERVQANGKHLLGLINDVLDLAKIEAGQLSLAVGGYSVKAVVQSVIDATESLARAKGLALAADVGSEMPDGAGDERRLTQVLLNVVGNAIKFTDAGSVTVTATADAGFFTIAVADTGPGIPADQQARIFEEFQQVDNSSTRKKGGSGLGLAISKRIIELHGGTISVQSTLGQGSTFLIHLPIQAVTVKEVA